MGRKTFDVIPVPPPAGRVKLALRNQRVYQKTGTIGVEYDIVRGSGKGARRRKR